MSFDQLIKVAQLVTPVLMAVLVALAKQAFGRMNDRVDHTNLRIDGVHETLRRQDEDIEELKRGKVGEEEWLRETMRLRDGQEKQMQMLSEVNGKLDASLTIGHSIDRLANAIAQNTETDHAG